MPHTLEFPGMLRAVVPLVRRQRCATGVVGELVAVALGCASWSGRLAFRRSGLVPSLAAVIGALNNLAEPPAGLRDIQPVGIHRRSLHVIDLPARKVGTAHVPFLAFAIRS